MVPAGAACDVFGGAGALGVLGGPVEEVH